MIDMGETMTTENGATWFTRCARCYALYEAEEGLHIPTGETRVYWTRPQERTGAQTKTVWELPIPCDHAGDAEMWDGKQWILVPLRQEMHEGGPAW